MSPYRNMHRKPPPAPSCRPCEVARQSLPVLMRSAPPPTRVPAPHEMAPFTIADAVAGLVLPRGAHFEWDTPLASDLERNAAVKRLAALEAEHAALRTAAEQAVAYISGLSSSQRDRRAADVMNGLMRALRPGRDVK